MKNLIKVTFLMLVFSVSVRAQEQNHLDVNTVVQKEEIFTNEKGETETRLVPVGTVIPGERVIYTITFRNVGTDPAENVVITNPIADSLTYLEGSAFGPGAAIEFSIDGGTVYADASNLSVIEDGVSRAATAEDYTHIRWVMQNDLAVGAQAVARFTAVLN